MSQRYATDDPEGLLASHGWQAEVIEYGEDGANFGRWAWSPVDRRDPNWPHNNHGIPVRSSSRVLMADHFNGLGRAAAVRDASW